MNNLLIFFAIPIAIIVVSIALQRLLKSPLLIAEIAFSIGLIVTVILDDLNILVATVAYTIISFTAALMTYYIHKVYPRRNGNNCGCNTNNVGIGNQGMLANTQPNVFTLGQPTSANNDVVNFVGTTGTTNQSNCTCNCTARRNTNPVNARVQVIPNVNNNGRTGCICGNYTRQV